MQQSTMMQRSEKTHLLALSAVFAALIFLFTAYLFHIPTPFGYTHFGNTLIFLVGTLLPAPYAFAAAAVGCGLADLLTAPVWVVPTVIIKGCTALMMSNKTEKIICPRNMVGLALAYTVNVGGYFICTGLMYGSWLFNVARVFTDLVSPLICAFLFLLIGRVMDKTDMKAKFHL